MVRDVEVAKKSYQIVFVGGFGDTAEMREFLYPKEEFYVKNNTTG